MADLPAAPTAPVFPPVFRSPFRPGLAWTGLGRRVGVGLGLTGAFLGGVGLSLWLMTLAPEPAKVDLHPTPQVLAAAQPAPSPDPAPDPAPTPAPDALPAPAPVPAAAPAIVEQAAVPAAKPVPLKVAELRPPVKPADAGSGRRDTWRDTWTVQLGSFQRMENADALRRTLVRQGFDAYALDWTGGDRRTWRTVRVGHVESAAAARRL